jgi:hypothetical protein
LMFSVFFTVYLTTIPTTFRLNTYRKKAKVIGFCNDHFCHFEGLSILEFILKIFVCFDLEQTWLKNQITLAVS